MLRKTRGDAVIKLIDFGCSEVLSHPEEEKTGIRLPSRNLTHEDGATTAYCPPEAFDDKDILLDGSVDMWALGVIVYMMVSSSLLVYPEVAQERRTRTDFHTRHPHTSF